MARKHEKNPYSDFIKPTPPKPPEPDPIIKAEAVQRFLDEQTFLCSKLHNARMTLVHCVERQKEKPAYRSAYAPRFNDDPKDIYCRSGQCPVGVENKKRVDALEYPMHVRAAYVVPFVVLPPPPSIPSPKLKLPTPKKASRKKTKR